MASRKRIFYQSENLHVAASGIPASAADITQINRVQNINYSFELARTDVNQFGQLAAIDRIIIEQPTVSLDFSYYPTTGLEESGIGLKLNSASCISSILDGLADIKSYYIFTAPEGIDANLTTPNADADDYSATTDGSVGVIGVGNSFLTSYSAEGSVGEFLNASINVEALNMTFDPTTDDISVPTVNPIDGTRNAANTFNGALMEFSNGGTTVVALRHGDMSLTNAAFDSLVTGVDYDDLKVQNFSFSFDLSREDLQKIGSKFAFSKVIEFPASATMDVSAVVGVSDNVVFGVDQFLLNDANTQDLVVTCNRPGTSDVGMKYTLKGAKLDSESFSASIGDSKTVDMSFSSQIGGPNDTSNGIRIDNA